MKKTFSVLCAGVLVALATSCGGNNKAADADNATVVAAEEEVTVSCDSCTNCNGKCGKPDCKCDTTVTAAGVVEKIAAPVEEAKDKVEAVAKEAGNKVSNTAKKATESAKKATEKATDAAKDAAQKATDDVKNAADKAVDAATSKVNQAKQAAIKATKDAENAVKDAAAEEKAKALREKMKNRNKED
ncbi:MAG: hypothetical protein HDS13_09795 [Bacteroides sp.]|nr:hypothetical protein [Bacteroides sp.]